MINFYTRQRCPLCDVAKKVLDDIGEEYRSIDIGGDPGLEGEFGTRVPVIEVDEEVVFEGGMDPSDLPEIVEGAERLSGSL
ncbi:MAG TPA: glutaredoxin family protein [Actinomycetota bacterium]|nr:glutaredoxin family protein [Actinomycetota bacterium]